jgi:hypothetical protein
MTWNARETWRTHLALAGVVLVWCGPESAAPHSAGGPSLSAGVEAVLACRTVFDPASQLTCFQKASETLAAEYARPATQQASAPPPAPRPFGAPRPQPLRDEARPVEADRITVKVVAMDDRGDGRIVFRFDDGSTWAEIDAEPVAGSLRVGQSVTIRHGVISGFELDIPGRSFVRVRRLGGN